MLAIFVRVSTGRENSTVQAGGGIQVVIKRDTVQVSSHLEPFSHRLGLITGVVTLGFFVRSGVKGGAV